MNIKKLIRLFLKVPATPFITSFYTCMIITSFVIKFFEWVYDANNEDKILTEELINDYIGNLKRWFTTL